MHSKALPVSSVPQRVRREMLRQAITLNAGLLVTLRDSDSEDGLGLIVDEIVDDQHTFSVAEIPSELLTDSATREALLHLDRIVDITLDHTESTNGLQSIDASSFFWDTTQA
ncbi:MAG: hypothetical protein EA401_06080 [Planctomycetota bacterium]|nr:MAG: hypothetical protein EA401_06080 [Planctomycetota bacterium]